MNIVPIVTGIPAKTITSLKVTVGGFDTSATTCNLIYTLFDSGNTLFTSGSIRLTAGQFSGITVSNLTPVEDIVLSGLGLTRL